MEISRYFPLAIFIFFTIYKELQASTVSFCDGPNMVEKTREQCSAGISFGTNKPECICVSGIYRFIADTCETADGFADKVCTKITDESGMGASIIGVKFTRDPTDWSQTGIVCERKGFGSATWDFITEKHSRGATTNSTNIYGVNGKVHMTKGHYDKQAFCIEPSTPAKDEKICRYLKSENSGVWKDHEVEVNVKAKCDGTPLSPHKCFGVLSTSDSECELQCSESTKSMGRSMQQFGRAFSNKKPAPRSTNKGPATPPPPPPLPEQKPEVGIHPMEYWKHDNQFLNRKMMIYNIISQLNTDGDGNGTNSSSSGNETSWGEPKRTFEIFDMMKEITEAYCPAKYVAPDWIDLVIEMFYILHKGNIFRYDENLSPYEFEWIKDILSKCHDRLQANGTGVPGADLPVILSSESTDEDPNGNNEICNANGGKATGFCNGTNDEGECNFKPIKVEDDRANDSFHYVPDVAWDIVDLIQVVCFQEFNESYRMFHVIEQAAERLFTLQIKNLWYYPHWSQKTKKRLLGTSADTQIHNLEVCIYSAYEINGQIPRLVRPPPVKYLRKKRAVSQLVSQGQNVDFFCGKSRNDFIMPKDCKKDR